ncbi:MAG: dTDP-4-dehydrorhamnose 3,5-epimerase [Synergistales bacterium]
MKATALELNGLWLFQPEIFADERGAFMETWNARKYLEFGVPSSFVQDNLSRSSKGTLRGLHFQNPRSQGKLVCALKGQVWDVSVDLRLDSPTFGRWKSVTLDAGLGNQLYIPPGFAHGFCTLSEEALFFYKCTDYYSPRDERGIAWNDPCLAIDWPIREPILSLKDRCYPSLKNVSSKDLFLMQHSENRPPRELFQP